MKALVRHRFGGPGVVRVEEVDRPALTDDRVLVRVRASSLNKADWHELRGWPRFLRPVTRNGVLRPKTALLGTDFAGVVEAVGKDVTDLAPGDEVFGARSGAFAEYVSAAQRRPEAVQRHVRGGRDDGDRGTDRAPGAPGSRQSPAGRARADQRRLGRCRHARRPDREGARRTRDRGVQHAQRRADARARRRPRARLHAPGLHPRARALRPRARRRRRALVARDPARSRAARVGSWSSARTAAGPSCCHIAAVWLASRRQQAPGQVLRRQVQPTGPPDARRPARPAAS